ncbi:MAG: hypothetical protein SF069_13445 [Phycisphaerae bacterium]|nr:hypothetical protein [Phycisphaerae bacterium]
MNWDTRSRAAALTAVLAWVCPVSIVAPPARAAEQPTTASAPAPLAPDEARAIYEIKRRGVKYLISAQEASGAWAGETGVGITALCARALAESPDIGPDHAAVKRAVEFVIAAQRPDGGIYSAEGLLKNYETSVAVSMLSRLPGDKHRPAIDKAVAFLKDGQWDESEDKRPDDPWYGGAGYGRGQRPDMSNVQIMLDALRDSGLPPSDPAYQKALVFIQRSQMRGESNDQPFARGSVQGGFIYSPANGGESKAGEVEIEGRRELCCYGSMTYAGLKSMIYAGLNRDDSRVQAAVGWITRNWTLDQNPNYPNRSQEGLYYFYMTLARALAAFGDDELTLAKGDKIRWRDELTVALQKRQEPDGRWVNREDRWMEGRPELTTAYALIALNAAYPK